MYLLCGHNYEGLLSVKPFQILTVNILNNIGASKTKAGTYEVSGASVAQTIKGLSL